MDHARRHFLHRAGAGATLAVMARLALGQARAQVAEDYKALVCVFLFGGNDGNNLLIPADGRYASYSAVRNASSGIQIEQGELLAFQPKESTAVYGFHPAMVNVHSLMQSGKVAVLANVGPLVAPITKTDYLANRDRPYQLFSHSDQQAQWQNLDSREFSRTGWGGRLADAIAPVNGAASLPVLTSLSGTVMFGQGNMSSMLALPSSGTFGLSGISETDAVTRARAAALLALLDEGANHTLLDETASGLRTAISLSGAVNPVISTANPTVDGAFATASGSLASQLHRVARLIARRADFGLRRQVFFVALGGFDTHANQATTQANLLSQIDAAVSSFYQATVALGLADRVTTFTMSDFGRTFKPASGGGSDHAWGNHHLIVGGAVKGGKIYGRFPELAIGGPDDVGTEGRWLPTTSVDQYAATLAAWFGVPPESLPQVVPNINAFSTKHLGFI